MKKFVLSILSVLLILSFVSCGSDPDAEGDNPIAPNEQYDNESILEAIEEARDLAIEADAEYVAPSMLDSLDVIYDELYTRAENEENIVKEGKELADGYLALAYYLQALELKDEIDDTEMEYLAQTMYDQGCADLAELEEMYDSEKATSAQLLAKASSAKTCFEAVINAIYKSLAVQARQAAMDAKKDADSVKAGVAMSDDYAEAVDYFKEGDSLYSRQQTKAAYDNYIEASDLFEYLFEEVSERREEAERAIEAAKERVRESAEFAESADEVAPITEALDGIEDEDAVLLEEDEYDDPSDAEIDLPEYIDDQYQIDVGDAK